VAADISYEINNKNPDDKKRFIRRMFDSIVPTYDLLNHLLSFGTDIFWRKNIFHHLNEIKGSPAIDICCGTGDLSLLLYKKGAKVVSLDFSLNMLKKGMTKNALKGYPVSADASMMPFKSNAFALATIAFGIRNLPDIDNFIQDVFRVLAPGGQLAILELVRPKNKIIGKIHSYYLGAILPLVGGVVSGRRFAYLYLAKTINTFIDQSDLKIMLERYGFKHVAFHPQTFGVATIVVCEKEAL
jgi:demethylmenaquinone methyltransferase / 2-methoxy-6-polyprenyl-1,4-benzoquinol methylase